MKDRASTVEQVPVSLLKLSSLLDAVLQAVVWSMTAIAGQTTTYIGRGFI